MKKGFQIVLIVIFLLAISLPLLFSDKSGGTISAIENRVLAPFPTLYTEDRQINMGVLTEFENWINDNAAGRSFFSKLNTKINYHVFGQSAKTDTLLGKDKWTFYYTDLILKDYQNTAPPSEAELANDIDNYGLFRDYLRNRGIPLIGVLVPDKKTVYPEYYPDTVLKVNDVSRSDILMEAYRAAGYDIMYLLEELEAYKRENPEILYSPRTDNAHWNEYGAFVGYQAIAERMKSYIPAFSASSREDWDITEYELQGLFNGTVPITEEAYRFEYKTPGTAIIEDQNYYDDFPGMTFADGPQVYRKYYQNPDRSSPKVLLIGDSYCLNLYKFFYTDCAELSFVHLVDAAYVPEIIDKLNPDIVVYEYVERGISVSRYALDALAEKIKAGA